MPGQDYQDKLDAIVADLQTKGKGQEVVLMLRGDNNRSYVFPVSSDSAGVVDPTQLSNIQSFVNNNLKNEADAYEAARAPVSAALDAFKTAQTPHQTLIDASKVTRDALSAALTADPTYQAAKTALDTIHQDPTYVAATAAYKDRNVSENFNEFSQAKGKYTSP